MNNSNSAEMLANGRIHIADENNNRVADLGSVECAQAAKVIGDCMGYAALDPFTGNEDAVSAGAAAACTRDGQSGSAANAVAISARSTLRLAVSALIPSREDEDWVSSEVSDEYER